jgi:hypothetical protein
MKRILFFIVAISAVVSPASQRFAFAEMKSYFPAKTRVESQSVSRGIIPYEQGGMSEGKSSGNYPMMGYHEGKGENIRLGPFDLGIEGNYLERDPYERTRSRFDRFMMQGFIGFRF